MPKGFNEGLGDLASSVGGAIKNDILKGSGPWEQFVNSLFSNNLKNKIKNFEQIKKKIKDFDKHEAELNAFIKNNNGKSLQDIYNDLSNRSDDDSLFKHFRWSYFLNTKVLNVKGDEVIKNIIFQQILQISSDKDKDPKDPVNKPIEDLKVEILKLLVEKVKNVVLMNEKLFQEEWKKATQGQEVKKENNMSFKNFYESKKIKEDLAASPIGEPSKDTKIKQTQVALKNADLAKSKQKLAQAQTIDANNQAKAAKQMAEGVYAGADGKPKKIPFTQDPTLKNQAVSPKPDAKDDTVEDEAEKNAKKKKKDLEEITKELQKLADEACDVAMNNIDPTEGTLIDKMAAREESGLKESQLSWSEMEKTLNRLDEGCAGGVCSMGGDSPDIGGSFGIMPIGSIAGGLMGSVSTPNPKQQVADRSTIYSFIKDNDLNKTSRDYALNALLDRFGNSSTELSQILSDAILSDGSPNDIDSSYGYSDSLMAIQAPSEGGSEVEDVPSIDYTQQGDIAQDSQLKNAWAQMEQELKDL
jgi:hypothetical protein